MLIDQEEFYQVKSRQNVWLLCAGAARTVSLEAGVYSQVSEILARVQSVQSVQSVRNNVSYVQHNTRQSLSFSRQKLYSSSRSLLFSQVSAAAIAYCTA